MTYILEGEGIGSRDIWGHYNLYTGRVSRVVGRDIWGDSFLNVSFKSHTNAVVQENSIHIQPKGKV